MHNQVQMYLIILSSSEEIALQLPAIGTTRLAFSCSLVDVWDTYCVRLQ